MKTQANVLMTFEDKTFKNEKGESVDYVEILGKIYGEVFRFSVRKEDKALLLYLRNKQEVK